MLSLDHLDVWTCELSAPRQRLRGRRRIYINSPALENLAAALRKPLPILTDLVLRSPDMFVP